MTNLKFNSKLSQLAIDQIKLHPKIHEQSIWHSPCGTSHCWYGWCEVLCHIPIGKNCSDPVTDSAELVNLELDSWEWRCITNGLNSIDDLENYHKELTLTNTILFNKEGYDRDGFNINNLDRHGKSR